MESGTYLKTIYENSRQENPAFSQRDFARKLGLSAGGLSQIFAGKKKLSVSRGHEIAAALSLAAEEREYFLLLIQIESARSESLRSELYERLKIQYPQKAAHSANLTLEQFRLISEWYGLAILQLVSTYGATWSPQRIASHLGIELFEAKMALERLIKLEIIEDSSTGWKRLSDRIVVRSGVPNEAIQNYYKGVFERARESAKTQTPQEKVIGTEVFAFDPSELEKVRKVTDEYLDQLLAIAKAGSHRSEMYQVVVDFFRLSERNSK